MRVPSGLGPQSYPGEFHANAGWRLSHPLSAQRVRRSFAQWARSGENGSTEGDVCVSLRAGRRASTGMLGRASASRSAPRGCAPVVTMSSTRTSDDRARPRPPALASRVARGRKAAAAAIARCALSRWVASGFGNARTGCATAAGQPARRNVLARAVGEAAHVVAVPGPDRRARVDGTGTRSTGRRRATGGRGDGLGEQRAQRAGERGPAAFLVSEQGLAQRAGVRRRPRRRPAGRAARGPGRTARGRSAASAAAQAAQAPRRRGTCALPQPAHSAGSTRSASAARHHGQ